MALNFNQKTTNIYIDVDNENNVRMREYDKKVKEFVSKEINKEINNKIVSKVSNNEHINDRRNTNQNINSLLISSNLVTEKECYNDYMIKLSESIKLSDLNINNIILPKRISENILNNNNKLSIEKNDENKIFELEPNYYNRNEIVDFLNEGFIENLYNLKVYINSEDKFVFESTDGEKFKMISSDDCILRYLGFNKNTYLNKIKYIAENSLDVGDNIFYLVIENISEEPMFRIDMDSEFPQIDKLLNFNEDIEIDHLIIKFNKTKNSLICNDPKYSFFFESEHEIDFEFV
jgi:hypothetical protein